MLLNDPNSIFWNESLHKSKRDNTQMYFGEVVDTEGDGGYKAALEQKYSVQIHGWGVIIKNCKVQVSHAGHNGGGEYLSLKPGDIITGFSKEGSLEDFVITGGVRLNGNHQQLSKEGQGMKPGELASGSLGKALSNQVSLHPSRVTKPDSEFQYFGSNVIRSEYDDPIFGGGIEAQQEMQPIPGIMQMRNRGGVIVNYAYGGIVNYTDANFVVSSAGTSENKCSFMLKNAKRHLEIAKSLSSITGMDVTNFKEFMNNADDLIKKLDEASITSSTSLNLNGITTNATDVEIDQADIVSQLLSQNTSNNPSKLNMKETLSFLNYVNATTVTSNYDSNYPMNPGYRQENNVKLAKMMLEEGQKCNVQSAAMHSAANIMQETLGSNLGAAGSPQEIPNSSSTPNQSQAPYHLSNAGSRSTEKGCGGHAKYEECNQSDLVQVGKIKLKKNAAAAYKKMWEDAKKEGADITPISGFRSIKEQATIWNRKKQTMTSEQICKTVAPPGFSQHHTGCAVDIFSLETGVFAKTKGYSWMQKNASKYGFVQSLAAGQTEVAIEEWHYVYKDCGN